MPSYIVKASPDEDWYVIWSTIVDTWTYAGTRAELMDQAWSWNHSPDNDADERFARADERGTSANWPDWPAEDQVYGWGDETFGVGEGTPDGPDEDGWWDLPRKNLRAYVEAQKSGQSGAEFLTWTKAEDDEA